MKCLHCKRGMCHHPTVLKEVPGEQRCIALADWNDENSVQPGMCVLVESEAASVPAGKKDMVDRPNHYSRYGMETIDAQRGTMSPEEFNGFLKGNAFKYLTRAGAKDDLEQDLHKVVWYAAFLYLTNGGTVEKLQWTCDYMKGRFSK